MSAVHATGAQPCRVSAPKTFRNLETYPDSLGIETQTDRLFSLPPRKGSKQHLNTTALYTKSQHQLHHVVMRPRRKLKHAK